MGNPRPGTDGPRIQISATRDNFLSFSSTPLFTIASTPQTEIKIGNIIAYSGPASAYGVIGKADEAYFRKINAEGGHQRPQDQLYLHDVARHGWRLLNFGANGVGGSFSNLMDSLP